jgi:hypothetical protein
MAYSADGVNWTAIVGSPFGTSSIHAIAYGNGSFVAGGHGSYPGYSGKLVYSED